MTKTIGYKYLRADGSSINGDHKRVTYGKRWQSIPGNGSYVGFTWDGLIAGGESELIAEVECRNPTGVTAPNGVTCYRRVRVLRWLSPPTKPARDAYIAAIKQASDAYDAAIKQAWDSYVAARKPASDAYNAATKQAFRRMMKSCKPANNKGGG